MMMRAAATAPASGRWHPRHLFAAPHRFAFAAAALVLMLSSLWWAAACLAARQGVPVAWQVPRAVAHGTLMTFGFMPLFFTGFLFTAGPKWLRVPTVPVRALVRPVALQVSGWLVFVAGCHRLRVAAALGVALVALGWMATVARFTRMVMRSPETDRVHTALVAAASALGVLGLAAVGVGIAREAYAVVLGCILASLWTYVGVVFVTASHRMLPFFSAAVPALDERQPFWLLGSLVAGLVLEGAAAMGDVLGAPSAPPWRIARACLELLGGSGVIALAVRWARMQSLKIRLLAMLDAGLAWLGVALLIAGAARLSDDHYGAGSPWGLAATHAYTMGFLGSTMFAMVSRVSSGHGGRTVAADGILWGLFGVLQVVVLARLAGAGLALSHPAVSSGLVVGTAAGWAAVCLAWGLRYGRWYGTPRPDGRPG